MVWWILGILSWLIILWLIYIYLIKPIYKRYRIWAFTHDKKPLENMTREEMEAVLKSAGLDMKDELKRLESEFIKDLKNKYPGGIVK